MEALELTRFLLQQRQEEGAVLTRAGGEGLDIKGATQVILMEPSWYGAAEHQVIGRAVRYQSHSHLPPEQRYVNVWRLVLRKSVDRLLGDTKWDSVDVRVRELPMNKEAVNDKTLALVESKRVMREFKEQFYEAWTRSLPVYLSVCIHIMSRVSSF